MPPPLPSCARPRLVCLVNGIYSSQIGGGDIYFSHVARAAVQAGYPIHFFGGHALRDFLASQGLPLNLTLTDPGAGQLGDVTQLRGQLRLVSDFARRLRSTLRQLDQIRPTDIVYAMSDYWFDAIPLQRCCARAKIMYLGMMAPTFWEVLTRGRPDVTSTRAASLYYWASQQSSLRRFRKWPTKMFTYGHPNMEPYLRRFGYRPDELAFVTNGMDVEVADRVPDQAKQFDLAWTGRVHPQKGIEDLLATLSWLAANLDRFQAVIIGRSRDLLAPRIAQLGLSSHVTFAGLVSEDEKFRLLKASRVFAMPSYYESWGIVVGEALCAGLPVVAYDLECYRPVFGEFVRYVPLHQPDAFTREVHQTILAMRQGTNYLDRLDLAGLKHRLSWTTAHRAFVGVLEKMTSAAGPT